MNPIFFRNIYKTAIWGGNNLNKLFHIKSPFEKTSEIWTASAHENGETPITVGGETVQLSLSDYYKKDYSKEFFGANCLKYSEFPLLIKWIDANDKLSVQVHPDDNYAKKFHQSFGKTEAWYIVSAKPGAQIVYGLKPGKNKQDLQKAIEENKIEEVLNFVPVKAGDVFYIPSGMVHALLDGVIVYEIQQSSDITYRLYDWNRVDENGNRRELHVTQAMDVIACVNTFNSTPTGRKVGCKKELLNTQYFKLRSIDVKDSCNVSIDNKSFRLYSVVKGSVTIEYNGGHRIVESGESFMIPAAKRYVETFCIKGNASLLEASVK